MTYANSADPDQTVPSESALFAILLSILRNYINKQNLVQNCTE